MTIITKDSLTELVTRGDQVAMHAIGRALVHLLRRQTEAEQRSNTTMIYNNIGFTGADARSGSITAKYYIKHQRLEDWQIERWLKPGKSGYPRIAKYWRQINDEAEKKAAERKES